MTHRPRDVNCLFNYVENPARLSIYKAIFPVIFLLVKKCSPWKHLVFIKNEELIFEEKHAICLLLPCFICVKNGLTRFVSKNLVMEKFEILFPKSVGYFTTGETVHGIVSILLKESIKARKVTLKVKGQIETKWSYYNAGT